ncbi:MAG: DUF4267 domain-containing protein [Hyalangium sp.]|uniref:DUF4267 domain-containing protein n=1 Tax=Hyalangium sp. TaxID=2028555 RepID=UPI00389ACD0E
MQSNPWPDRLARAFAILRGAVLVPYSVMLFLEPEKVMPGSSTEPARTFALMFASRTILLGIAFFVLAIRGKREGLAGLLLADAALQFFDTGMALVTHKGALAVVPAAIGVIGVWAGLFLLRAARGTVPPTPPVPSSGRASPS